MKPFFLILLILVLACAPPAPDLEQARSEILALEAAQRVFHVEKNAGDFVKLFSDDFVSISRGSLSFPDSATNLARFSRYFSSVEFLAWDDVTPPIIRISDDATMAYSILDKVVIITYTDETGTTLTDTTYFAWTTLYRKKNGQWKIDAVTSTNKE